MTLALALLLAAAVDDATRGPLVEAEPVWTGVFTAAGAGGGAALGVVLLVEATVLTPPGSDVAAVVDGIGLILPIAGAVIGAGAVGLLFLSPDDALLVGVLSGSAALAAGAIVLFAGAGIDLAAPADAPPSDQLVVSIVAASAAVVGAGLVAGAVASLLDETAYW